MSNVPQPKMFNSPKYRERHGEINWDNDFIRCEECGQVYKRSEKKEKMKQNENYDWICIGECNFN